MVPVSSSHVECSGNFAICGRVHFFDLQIESPKEISECKCEKTRLSPLPSYLDSSFRPSRPLSQGRATAALHLLRVKMFLCKNPALNLRDTVSSREIFPDVERGVREEALQNSHIPAFLLLPSLPFLPLVYPKRVKMRH